MSLHKRSLVLLQNLQGNVGSDPNSESLQVVTSIGRSSDSSLNKLKKIRDAFDFISSWNADRLKPYSDQIKFSLKIVTASSKDFSTGENTKVLNRQRKLEKALQELIDDLKTVEDSIVVEIRSQVSNVLVDDYKLTRLKENIPKDKVVKFEQLSRDLNRLAVCNRDECPTDLSGVKGKIVEYATLVQEFGEDYPPEVESFMKKVRERYTSVTLNDVDATILEFLHTNNLAMKFEIKERK